MHFPFIIWSPLLYTVQWKKGVKEINCQKQAQVGEGMVIAALFKYSSKKDDRKKGR